MLENRFKEWGNNPSKLEEVFRTDEKAFKKDFYEYIDGVEETDLIRYWRARLEYKKLKSVVKKPIPHQVISTLIICVILYLLTKIPDIIGVPDKSFFFEKNLALIIISGLLLVVFHKNRSKILPVALTGLFMAGCVVYINTIPELMTESVSHLLKLHLPFLLWFVWCFSYEDFSLTDIDTRNKFIRNNGNIAIISIVTCLGLFALAGLSIALFSLIQIDIEEFMEENIFMWIVVSSPIIAFVITENYPNIAGKIATIMVRVFSPITLTTLLIYLALLPFSTHNLYENRGSLLVFNLSLFLVLAIMAFGLLDTEGLKSRFYKYIYLFLGIVAFVINVVALSAIFYRVNEYGLSPNRLAVLGSNLVVSVHLAMLILALHKYKRNKCEQEFVSRTVGLYLPVYAIWLMLVLSMFPILF